MRTVLVALTVVLTLALACGATAEPEEQDPPPETGNLATPVTDTEYCRNVSEAVNEIPDYFPVIKEYSDAVLSASMVKPAYYEEVMAGKKFLLDIDVLTQLDYIDETATAIKDLDVPENATEGHRKAENLADDVMTQTDEIRKKYAEMTGYEGYAYITQHGISNSAPEAKVMFAHVEAFAGAYTELVSVYFGQVLNEFRGSDYCAGWWKVE